MEVQTSSLIPGGGFLIQESTTAQTFIPEDFNEEQHMIIDMCKDFLEKDVTPNLAALDAQQPGLMVSLLEKAGDLGLLGAAFPEEFGGLAKIL